MRLRTCQRVEAVWRPGQGACVSTAGRPQPDEGPLTRAEFLPVGEADAFPQRPATCSPWSALADGRGVACAPDRSSPIWAAHASPGAGDRGLPCARASWPRASGRALRSRRLSPARQPHDLQLPRVQLAEADRIQHRPRQVDRIQRGIPGPDRTCGRGAGRAEATRAVGERSSCGCRRCHRARGRRTAAAARITWPGSGPRRLRP